MVEGYYGLIQYMPRPETLEGVNIGVYLFCPRLGFVRVKLAPNHNSIRRRFPGLAFNSVRLHADMRAAENRIVAASASGDLSEIQMLAARNYGQVMITLPLPLSVQQPSAELEELYKDLVEEVIHPRHRIPAPDIQEALRGLGDDVPVDRNVRIPIPILERKLVAPVAYLNKARNYVKPHGFPDDERRAMDAASNIGVVGHLLSKNKTSVEGEEVAQHLIVVANLPVGKVLSKVAEVLNQFETDVVSVDQIGALIQRIREHARRPQPLHN